MQSATATTDPLTVMPVSEDVDTAAAVQSARTLSFGFGPRRRGRLMVMWPRPHPSQGSGA